MLQQISLFRKVQCPIQIRGFFSGKKKQRKKKKDTNCVEELAGGHSTIRVTHMCCIVSVRKFSC